MGCYYDVKAAVSDDGGAAIKGERQSTDVISGYNVFLKYGFAPNVRIVLEPYSDSVLQSHSRGWDSGDAL